MQARYVPRFEVDAVLQPDAAVWRAQKPETVKLKGTPLDMQPSGSIKISWEGKKIGAVEAVQVAAIHDGERIAFRLEWSDPAENREIGDTTDFPDGCGVLLPSVEFAPMAVMGAVGMAVNAWHWRADENGRGRQLLAEGLGTTRIIDEELVRGNGVYENGRWHVVITRPMKVQSSESLAQLEPGKSSGFGVAIWEGGHGERAGIKAISGDNWIALDIEAATGATT
jgi:complex iron-sulfur molybdoenzyme family reductase subunit gamma